MHHNTTPKLFFQDNKLCAGDHFKLNTPERRQIESIELILIQSNKDIGIVKNPVRLFNHCFASFIPTIASMINASPETYKFFTA